MKYFQDYMPGNICFGCGRDNPEGLQISSYWEGDVAICRWESSDKYQGWLGVMNGGIIASLIDCHSMGTAMAAAYRAEGRALGTEPYYRYATGTMEVKYLKPTPNGEVLEIRCIVTEIKGRKTTMYCEAWSGRVKTAEAKVIALRVGEESLAAHGSK